MAQVELRPGDSIESALRKFKKQIMESGILKDARAHEFYEKPSDKRRREAASRMRKLQKARRIQESRDGRQ